LMEVEKEEEEEEEEKEEEEEEELSVWKVKGVTPPLLGGGLGAEAAARLRRL
jgi:hypothetical protein